MSDLQTPTRVPSVNGEMASYGDDKRLFVSFSREPVYMEFKSVGDESRPGAGYPVYEDKDFISITVPGAKTDMKRQVKLEDDLYGPSDPHRFPRQWAAFKDQNLEVHDGLPIENWPAMPSRTYALAFKAAKIFTVEQLAGLGDNGFAAVNLMDVRKWRDLAIAYLESAKGNAGVQAVQAENATLKAEMEALKAQFAEMSAKRGPGRPPKDHSNAET